MKRRLRDGWMRVSRAGRLGFLAGRAFRLGLRAGLANRVIRVTPPDGVPYRKMLAPGDGLRLVTSDGQEWVIDLEVLDADSE